MLNPLAQLPSALQTILLLICSNIFMTWAWYGHLKHRTWSIVVAVAVSWLIALPEYLFQVPANRVGHLSQGGPFTTPQLKIIQEAVSLTVFAGFAIVFLKESPRARDYVAFALIFTAVVIAMSGKNG